MRYGILVIAVCMLCLPFVLAESDLLLAESVPTGSVHTTSGITLPDISLPRFSAPVSAANPSGEVTAITFSIRKDDMRVIKGAMPVTGGTLNITNQEILVFTFTGKYTGPAGTYGMLDLYNYGGSYPIKGVPRVDGAIIIPAGKSGTLTSPPYWFAFANNGTYGYSLELFGNKTLAAFVPITVKVRSP